MGEGGCHAARPRVLRGLPRRQACFPRRCCDVRETRGARMGGCRGIPARPALAGVQTREIRPGALCQMEASPFADPLDPGRSGAHQGPSPPRARAGFPAVARARAGAAAAQPGPAGARAVGPGVLGASDFGRAATAPAGGYPGRSRRGRNRAAKGRWACAPARLASGRRDSPGLPIAGIGSGLVRALAVILWQLAGRTAEGTGRYPLAAYPARFPTDVCDLSLCHGCGSISDSANGRMGISVKCRAIHCARTIRKG